MPHYDYQCTNCQHQLPNFFQKIVDEPLKECPNCHQLTLKRGPGGGIGLVFQGDGFYINDYDPNRSSKPSNTDSSSQSSSCCPCGKNACS